jgi:PKD repeat protein
VRFSGGVAGVAASILIIGVAAIPAARAAGAEGGPATAVTTAATATTLYVDIGGSCDNSGPGTLDVPFCTVQEAANVVDPGQTVAIIQNVPVVATAPVVIARSGTPAEPITFAWAGVGHGLTPYLSPNAQTGKPVITLEDVHDVTLSHLAIGNIGTDDGIDVIGSSDISLENLQMNHTLTTAGPVSAAISVDGASSDVTVSRTNFTGSHRYAVLSKPGAQQVTLTTNLVEEGRGAGFTLNGTTGAVVTSNTVFVYCDTGTIAPNDVTLADGSSGAVENNVLETIAEPDCGASGAGLSVDANSADSAGGVTADYNAFYSADGSDDYSWAGTGYASPAAFSAATGQGAHDVALTAEVDRVPPTGSAAINSANCSAPGELSADALGNPWVLDPQAVDADLGNGTCYASRGAFAPQDPLPVAYSVPSLSPAGYPAGAVPYAFGVTVTSAETSTWGKPVSYTINFGDGGAPVPATPGTAAAHTYTAEGEYNVTITAVDTSGSTVSRTFQAFALPAQPTAAALTATPDIYSELGGITPDTADFQPSPSGSDWQLASEAINYGGAGDATTSDAPGATWSYAYAEPGTYTATLTVRDKLGRTSTAKATITVGDDLQDTRPVVDYSHTVAAHSVVEIPRSKLDLGDPTTPGALIDVSVTDAKKSGYVTVYPNGTSRPDLSTVQFQAGEAAENSALATGGTVDFYNGSAGPINLSVVTYGIDDNSTTPDYGSEGATFSAVPPATVLARIKVAGGHGVTFPATGRDHVPANAQDVVVDVTASGGTTAGHFATYSAYGWGKGSSVTGGYWAKGQQVTNLVTVPIGGVSGNPAVLDNLSSGSAYFTAEVLGYHVIDGSTSVFLPATPRRLETVTIAADRSVALTVSGKNGIPATGTTGVALDLTASEAAASGTVAAYADGTPLPFLISLSYARGIPVANAAIVAVGKDGAIRLYNSGSKPVAVNVDLTGSYYAYP